MRARLSLIATLLLALIALATAKLYVVTNAQSSTQINTVLSGLKPGDEVVFSSGTYTDMALRLDVAGSASDYITVKTANVVRNTFRETSKDVVLRADPSNSDSVLKFGTGSAYIQVEGIQFEHNSGATVENAGIRFENNVHHVTISSCVVKDITGIGIEMHDLDDIHDVTVKDSAIYNIGLGSNGGSSSNLGAGISAGSTTGTATSNTYNFVVKNNVFHDLQGNLGTSVYFSEGVKVSSLIDNVIWNSPNGAASGGKKAALYIAGGANAAADAASNIVVKGNAVLDSVIGGSNAVAVHAGAGANVFNNLIVNAQTGIEVAATFTTNLKNTRINHNTVYKVADTAISAGFTGLEDDTYVVSNNVLYVGDTITGLLGYVWTNVLNIGTAVVKKNYYKGETILNQVFADTEAFVSLDADASAYFSAPNANIGAGADFLVKGILLKAGIDVNVDTDYDNNDRDKNSPDVGCYETGSGGHWEVDYEFKVTVKSGDSAASTLQAFWQNFF